MERNNVHHLQAINKVRGLELTKPETEVDSQFQIGEEGLDEENHYLLRRNKEELLTSPIEIIRSYVSANVLRAYIIFNKSNPINSHIFCICQ